MRNKELLLIIFLILISIIYGCLVKTEVKNIQLNPTFADSVLPVVELNIKEVVLPIPIYTNKPIYTLTLRVYEIDKSSDIWHVKDSSSYINSNGTDNKLNVTVVVTPTVNISTPIPIMTTPVPILTPTYKEIIINSEPQGALLFIDSDYISTTPSKVILYMGDYFINLKINGYLTYMTGISVIDGGKDSFTFQLNSESSGGSNFVDIIPTYSGERVSYHILLPSDLQYENQLSLFDKWNKQYIYPYKNFYKYKIEGMEYSYDTNLSYCGFGMFSSSLIDCQRIVTDWSVIYPDVDLWIVIMNVSIDKQYSFNTSEYNLDMINKKEVVVISGIEIQKNNPEYYLHELGHAMNLRGDNTHLLPHGEPVPSLINCNINDTNQLFIAQQTVMDYFVSSISGSGFAQDELNMISNELFLDVVNETFWHEYRCNDV